MPNISNSNTGVLNASLTCVSNGRVFALGPSITDHCFWQRCSIFGTGPFKFLAFSNWMIFVASRPEGSAHFDPRAPWLRILARHRRPHGVRLAFGSRALVGLRFCWSNATASRFEGYVQSLRAKMWWASGGHQYFLKAPLTAA